MEVIHHKSVILRLLTLLLTLTQALLLALSLTPT